MEENKEENKCGECGELWNSEYHMSDECIKEDMELKAEAFEDLYVDEDTEFILDKKADLLQEKLRIHRKYENE